MTTAPIAVRPRPLPSQDKPWGKAGVRLLILYSISFLLLLKMSSSEGGDSHRADLAEAGVLPFIEGTEQIDPVTNEVVKIGPLNNGLYVDLIDDWDMSGYSEDDKQRICEVWSVDPGQIWQQLVTNMGFEDTPENQATSDYFYADECSYYLVD